MFKYPCRVIAHRGGGWHAPENTLAAMQACVAFGYSGVEFDVMTTKDGRLVLMHDHHPGRTIAAMDKAHRLISEEFLFDDLIAMDAGSWYNGHPNSMSTSLYNGEKVPSFESVIEYCAMNKVWMNIEIKPCPGYEALTGTLVAEHIQQAMDRSILSHESIPMLSSFSVEALMAAKQAQPLIPRALLVSGPIPDDIRPQLLLIDAVALHVDHQHLTEAFVSVCKTQYKTSLLCYTVNDEAVAQRLFAWGVDAICSDRLDLFRHYQ